MGLGKVAVVGMEHTGVVGGGIWGLEELGGRVEVGEAGTLVATAAAALVSEITSVVLCTLLFLKQLIKIG